MTHTEEVDELIEAAAALKDAQTWLEMKVAAAYLTGTSWAEIGKHLGTSKQTAYNRYAKFVDSLKDEPKTAYTPDEEAEGRAALAALQAVDARKTKEETAAKFFDGKAPAKSQSDRPAPGMKVKTKTEQDVLANYEAHRARKATLPEICPGCDTGRWHRHNTAYAGCTETQNDHVWSEEWPKRIDGTFQDVIGKHLI